MRLRALMYYLFIIYIFICLFIYYLLKQVIQINYVEIAQVSSGKTA